MEDQQPSTSANNQPPSETPPFTPSKSKNRWRTFAIFLVFIIVVLAAGGVWLWVKSDDKKSETNNSNTTQTADNDDATTKLLSANVTAPLNNPEFQLQYPADWTLTRNEVSYTNDQVYTTITNSFTGVSGDTTVMFSFANSGTYGGECGNKLTIVSTKMTETKIANIMLWEAVLKDGDIYIPFFNLIDTSKGLPIETAKGVKDIKVGDEICTIEAYGFGILFFDYESDTSNFRMAVGAIVPKKLLISPDGEIPANLYEMYRTDLTVDEINAAMNTEEYEQARDILLSISNNEK